MDKLRIMILTLFSFGSLFLFQLHLLIFMLWETALWGEGRQIIN